MNYITALGNQLAAVTDSRGLAWHFTIVDSREVNAFAVPGGWVYVNRGLIERATNMSELAGVLAHEIGHITRRHSVQQMQQAQGANIGLALACTLDADGVDTDRSRYLRLRAGGQESVHRKPNRGPDICVRRAQGVSGSACRTDGSSDPSMPSCARGRQPKLQLCSPAAIREATTATSM